MEKKIIYVSLVGDSLNKGHINLLNVAKKYGKIIVGLMTDSACVKYTSLPHFSYEHRKNFLLSNYRNISQIIPQEELDYSKNLKAIKPNFVIHGDDWKTGFQKKIRDNVIKLLKKWNGKLIEVPYTKNIALSEDRKQFLQSTTTTDIRKSKLKRLLDSKKIVKILEAHNPIGGLIIDNLNLSSEKEYDEFDGVWCSSLTDSSSRGKPDNQSLDLTTRINWLSEMFEVTSKPLIFDADNGGSIDHIKFLIRRLEKLGVSAVIMEDKIGLKKNSLFQDQAKTKLDTMKGFGSKIKTAVKNRISNDFLVIARLESIIVGNGIDEAIKRANHYSRCGADMILVHSKKKDPKEIFKFAKKFKKSRYFKPMVAVPSAYPSVKESELEKNGFKLVIYANHLLRASYLAMIKTADSILKNKRAKESEKDMISIKKVIELIE